MKKKRSEETQVLRAGCNKAEPKIFAPLQTPFQGAQDGQNLISWRRLLPLLTNPVWRGSMHAISSYRGNRPTHKQTNRTRLQYTALQLARSVITSRPAKRRASVDVQVLDWLDKRGRMRCLGHCNCPAAAATLAFSPATEIHNVHCHTDQFKQDQVWWIWQPCRWDSLWVWVIVYNAKQLVN